jgi:hypothetical protein
VKLLELVALPPFVVTAIVPVVAPVGTVAVIFESEFTVNEADTLLNVTFVACLRPVPVIVTEVPTGPLGGVKVAKVGVTLNCLGAVKVVVPVVTVTFPVSAPAGTVARMKVLPVSCLVVAAVPPNFTTDDELKPWPRMPTRVPSLPAGTGVTNEMKGDALMFSEKKVPSAGKGLPPWLFVPKIFPLVCCIKGAEGWTPRIGLVVRSKRNEE